MVDHLFCVAKDCEKKIICKKSKKLYFLMSEYEKINNFWKESNFAATGAKMDWNLKNWKNYKIMH